MSDDSDSWLQNAFGVNVADLAQNVMAAAAPVVESVEQAVAPAVQDFVQAAAPVVETVEAAAAPVLDTVADAGVSAAQTIGNAGESKVEGIWNAGVAGVQGVANAGAALVAPPPPNASFGEAVSDIAGREFDMAKSVYTGVTGVYDAVMPDYDGLSKSLNNAVDSGEDMVKHGNAYMVQQFGDVPIVGSAVRAEAAVSDGLTQVAGGLVKGVGDFGAMTGNILFHPIDTAPKIWEAADNIAEHVSFVPGGATIVKGAHGLVDLARGKTDGKYGANLSELGTNLLNDTERDPNDPTKTVNTDLQFAAGFGGGIKAWQDKPLEAFGRTVANIAPILMGEGGAKVPGEIPAMPGEVPVVPELPRAGLPEPVVEVSGQGVPPEGIPEVRPDIEPGAQGIEAKPLDPADAFNAAEKGFGDAKVDARAASDASYKATAEWAEYRRDVSRSDFDPKVDAELGARADALAEESLKRHNAMKSAKQAYEQVGGRPVLDVPGQPSSGAPAGRAGGTARLDQPVDAQPSPPKGRGGTVRLEQPPELPVDVADAPPIQPDPVFDVGPRRGPRDTVLIDQGIDLPPDLADGPPIQPDPVIELGPGRGPRDTVVIDRPFDEPPELADGPPLQADPIISVEPGRGPRDTLVIDKSIDSPPEIADGPPIKPDPIVEVRPGESGDVAGELEPDPPAQRVISESPVEAYQNAQQNYRDASRNFDLAQQEKVQAVRERWEYENKLDPKYPEYDLASFEEGKGERLEDNIKKKDIEIKERLKDAEAAEKAMKEARRRYNAAMRKINP